MFRNGTKVVVSTTFPKSKGCCQRVQGVMSAIEKKYAAFGDDNCKIKWCQVPSKIRSIWVCGCPGNNCYGEPRR